MFSIFKVDFGKLILLQLQIHYHAGKKNSSQENNGDFIDDFISDKRDQLNKWEAAIKSEIEWRKEERQRIITSFNAKRESREPQLRIKQGGIIGIFTIMLFFLLVFDNINNNNILLILMLLGGLAMAYIALGFSIYIPSKKENEYNEWYSEEMVRLHRSLLKILREK